MDVGAQTRRIADNLQKAASRRVCPFGVEKHQFGVLPPVPEAELRAFELQSGITLPADYRRFLADVSRGGAGPAYGLIPFGSNAALADESTDDFLRTAFPFTEAHGIGEVWADIDCTRLRAGTLGLCDEGCGYVHFLVCTGPARGEMWIDATVSDGGFIPLRVTFLQWFERWLVAALAGASGTWWLRD